MCWSFPPVSLCLRAGDRCLTVVSTYGPNGSVEYPTFLETLRGVLEGAPTGDSIFLRGDFNAHVGNDSDTWRGMIGRNGPPDLNSSGVLLLDFCASHSLSITNTMFKHKGVHQYTWYQDILGWRSMIDLVIVSSDLRPHVLDTRVKRGAELSTDHHLVVSWIRLWRRMPDRLGRPKRIVEEFKYLGVLFTSEGRMDREIDRRIGAVAAVMRSMYRSVVVKKELSRKAKLSIYQSIYAPTLTYGHELWVMTERVRSRIQAAEMSFLRRGAGRSLRDRVRSSVTPGGARSRAAAPPHRKGAVEVTRASVSDASRTSPWRGVPGMPHREEAPGKTQDTLERLCLSAGLGTPWGPPGRAGGSG
ncbi:hypothetical protein QTP70_001138 [Hemibagrus guttatus]|uniref:Endonuclease/exonuclease/phosphatase domain-containing protein n=1 Tax=Hemibagrus guttatus TaxID=175788 RepID=A0AAE0V321_9TELE|nr:hypothetical protein QTP70_001138 [Hemibagrus guttatus]